MRLSKNQLIDRLTALHIDSLEYRILVADLLMTFKILFVLIDLEATDYFTIYTGLTFVVTYICYMVNFVARL